MNCTCVFIKKDEICKHCQYLKTAMKRFVLKGNVYQKTLKWKRLTDI